MSSVSRDSMISEIRAARREWDEAIADLSDEAYENGEIVPGWTLKMVLGHLVAYLQLNVRHLRAFKKRKQLASLRARNWYQFNQREAAKLKKARLAEERVAFEQAYNELLTLLDALTDADLKQSFPSPWSVNDSRKVRLATVLRADVSNHLREHARQVNLWRR